jgi:hypothetical protein
MATTSSSRSEAGEDNNPALTHVDTPAVAEMKPPGATIDKESVPSILQREPALVNCHIPEEEVPGEGSRILFELFWSWPVCRTMVDTVNTLRKQGIQATCLEHMQEVSKLAPQQERNDTARYYVGEGRCIPVTVMGRPAILGRLVGNPMLYVRYNTSQPTATLSRHTLSRRR